MRFRHIPIAIYCALLLAGCQHAPEALPKVPVPPKSTLTPIARVEGRVIAVNLALKYVVADFPTGRLPVPGQRLSVYRSGQKVAEIVVSPQSRETTYAADIVSGDAQAGDEVRDD